jgi:hypothetical protein
MVILSISAAAVITATSTVVKREKEKEFFYRLDKMRFALAGYKTKKNRYPSKLEELLVENNIRPSCLTDTITGKEWFPVLAPLSEGYGIKDVKSSATDSSMRYLNGKPAKYSEF